MQNRQILCLIGSPGSGKTTFALNLIKENPTWVRINRDDLRMQLTGSYTTSKEVEDLITKIQNSQVELALSKFNVVIDNTHCKFEYIKELFTKFKGKAEIKVKFIGQELSLLDLIERNNKREKKVPESVLSKMYKQFRQLESEQSKIHDLINSHLQIESWDIKKQDKTLPKAIIVDLDGTICDHEGLRSPYDWKSVYLDKPIEEVISIIQCLSKEYKIIFVSGRDESCRELTRQWLIKHVGIIYEHLYMRPAGNFEKDTVIKKRIFNEFIRPNYYIEMLFDDRNCVVQMYREELGLKVAQVAYGDF